jgi:hypothetical protein
MESSTGFNIERLSLKISLSSLLIIALTVGFSMLAFNQLRVLCVCISNWLAWAWIDFAISTIIGFGILFISIWLNDSSKGFLLLEKILFSIELISFLKGIFFLIYFGSLLLRVI